MKSNPNIQFIAELNKRNLLNLWIFFDKVKYCSATNGGFIHTTNLKSISQELGIKWNTFRKKINLCVKQGWFKRKLTGYSIIGWKKICENFDLYLKKIHLKGNNKVDLLKHAVLYTIKNSMFQQFYVVYKNHQPGPLKNKGKALLMDDEFTVSTYYIARMLGFKSATSGTRYERRLKEDKLLKIESRSTRLTDKLTTEEILDKDPNMIYFMFSVNGELFRRRCNNLILCKKKK